MSAMAPAEHAAWLARLAAEDRARRAAAEPEIAHKEAALKAAAAGLQRSRDAVEALQAALDEAGDGEGAPSAAPPPASDR